METDEVGVWPEVAVYEGLSCNRRPRSSEFHRTVRARPDVFIQVGIGFHRRSRHMVKVKEFFYCNQIIELLTHFAPRMYAF